MSPHLKEFLRGHKPVILKEDGFHRLAGGAKSSYFFRMDSQCLPHSPSGGDLFPFGQFQYHKSTPSLSFYP
jgi:hypothetical protein